MIDLAEFQGVFADALRSRTVPIPACIQGATRGRAERRFAVYRNNVVASLIGALATRFPVVVRLVGEEFFRAMARVYVLAEPPRSPIMLYYGHTFPAFIEGFAPAKPIPYLADVARIEMARGLAYHAPDEEPLARAAFAALTPEQLSDLRLRFHASVTVVSSRFPAVSIWLINQRPNAAFRALPWAAEDALIARPRLEVEVHRLPPGAAAFLRALANEATLEDATQVASQATADFDAAEALALLIGSDVVVGLRAHRA